MKSNGSSNKLIVITGLSGAGKATAAKAFEDLSYTVVDNLPPFLLKDLVKKYRDDSKPGIQLAVVIDSRSGRYFSEWPQALDSLKELNIKPIIIFLDASDDVLIQRFKETRRKHPAFDVEVGILNSIVSERVTLEGIRELADKVIDTSDIDSHSLRSLLFQEFETTLDYNRGLTITIASFGFKHGIPLDADLVFDVRFLINPHYVPELRTFDGRGKEVEEYVMRDKNTAIYLSKLYDLLEYSIPQYIHEGKAYLTIAIGCTGGRHRSVVVAEKLGAYLMDKHYRVLIQHRDVTK